MADPKIRIKRSAVAGRIPSVDQVPLGELALNTWDGQLFASKNVGLGTTVVAINPWVVGTGTDSYNAYFTAGNIGIGSTTPTSALHVVGDAYISGVVTANAGFNLGISSAGSVITSGPIKTLNFIGAGNTFLVNGTTVDISIQGGGGSGVGYFVQNSTGIHTTSSVGIGTTTASGAAADPNNTTILNAGIVTANYFYGDGSGLTNVTAASGVVIRDSNVTVGTAATLNFGTGLSVTPVSAGIVTVSNLAKTSGVDRTETSFTATAGQTTFTVSYDVSNPIDVFLNGVRLRDAVDYTATSGTNIVLTTGASLSDSLVIIEYFATTGTTNEKHAVDRVVTEFTATTGQTTFSVAYTVGNIDVFFNGARLIASDYTATDGTSVVLTSAASGGDQIVVVEYLVRTTGNGISGQTVTTFTAGAGQTAFNVSYTLGTVQVYRNGIRLVEDSDYTANTGDSIVLVGAANSGDSLVVVESQGLFGVNQTGINTTSNLGIGTTSAYNALTVVGDANISGVLTATTLYGNGANLTGIQAGYFVQNQTGIHTTGNIGVGTTSAYDALSVVGDANVSGVVTATAFYGDGSNLQGVVSGVGVALSTYKVGYAQTTIEFIGSGVTVVSIGDTTQVTIEPGLVGAAKSVTSFTATAGQTAFNVNYSAGQENVFLNGARLSESQYSATNGSTIVLNDPAADGDSVDIVVYLRGADPNRNTNVTLLPPFNGITTAFTMYQGSTTYLFDPIDDKQIIVSLGGVIQQPGVAYTVGTGSSIFFSAAPGAGVSCFITALYSNTVGIHTDATKIETQSYFPTGVQTSFTLTRGYEQNYLDVYLNGSRLVSGQDFTATDASTFNLITPAQNGDVVEAVAFRTVGITSAVTAGISSNVDGNYVNTTNLKVTGISTLGNTIIGGGTTELLVHGDARVTGILTIGTSSITLDGSTNTITVDRVITSGVSTITSLDYSGISSSITGDAVAVFVYDTSRDSDGGAWRRRTQHTSWYNETLNTSTRGKRKEFPSVAVIVASNDTAGLTIYDGDDPDLPMWMIFNETGGQSIWTGADRTSVKALNGVIYVGQSVTIPLCFIDFIRDQSYNRRNVITQKYNISSISGRNTTSSNSTAEYWNHTLISDTIYSVDVTCLPNAPINPHTNLPNPTIVVGTDLGMSIIRDDYRESIVNLTHASSGLNTASNTKFTKQNEVIFSIDNNLDSRRVYITPIPGVGSTVVTSISLPESTTRGFGMLDDDNVAFGGFLLSQASPNGIYDLEVGREKEFFTASPLGITFVQENSQTRGVQDSLVAYAATDYNTGWMCGDIRSSLLSSTNTDDFSTPATTVYSDSFDNNDNGWNFVDCSINSGYLEINSVAAARATDLSWSGTTGVKYVAYITVTDNYDGFYLDDDGTGAGQGKVTIYANVGNKTNNATHVFYFTKTGSNRLRFIRTSTSSGTSIKITNFEIKALSSSADNDRSRVQMGAIGFGTITRSAVATGADLVGYSGWSASNYMSRGYTDSDVGIGTADFSVTFWAKATAETDFASVIDNGYVGNNYFSVIYNTSNGLLFRTAENTSVSDVNTPNNTVPLNHWNCVICSREAQGTLQKIYVNGKVAAASTCIPRNVTSYRDMRIGQRSDGNKPFLGSLALLRFSHTAITDEQAKKIYDDEKFMFVDNAKSTIYGETSSAVALSYDDYTNILHVGTSSGRSEFDGLVRINNTTTGINTSISAYGSFVAED